ncbi:TonB-dependent receptor family protein [Nostoc ellipsosporum NOK]|nr:TonB-dependent receptor family protein [Nostoc ellipsosporum NOK]
MKVFYFLFFFFYSTTAIAQTINLRGTVNDSVATLAGATVSLSEIQPATLTDSTGRFSLVVKEKKSYRLIITHAGYHPHEQLISLHSDTDLGTITLRQAGTTMQGVVVTAQHPVIGIGSDPNTIVYNVSASADAAGQTALETLKKAPGVSIANNTTISLNGRSGVAIMLDGKLSYLSGKELIDLLQAMPSSSIKSIEIINSPGAKYDAAGTAGIINIRTNKIQNSGLNGSIGSGFSYGITVRQNTDVNLNYRKNKFNFFFNYSHFVGRYTYDYGTDRLQNNRHYSSATYDVDKRQRFNSRLGMDYSINQKHTVGWMASANFITGGGVTDTRTAISLPGTATIDQLLDAINDYYFQHTQRYNANVNYQYEDKAGRRLNVDADMGYFNKANKNLQSNRYLDASEALQNETLYRTLNGIDIRLKAAKIDYTSNLWKGKIETGMKIAGVRSVNDGKFYHVKNTDSLDDRRSDYFSFAETVTSAYVNYKTNWKKWSWQAGLRMEHTDNKSDTLTRNYTNFFPAASVGYKPREAHHFSLAYSRRIDRPAYPDLNPFVYLLDELSYWQGNPYLQPQLTDRWSLQYVYRSSTVLGITYANTADYFARITDSINGNQLVMIPRNVGSQRNLGFTLTQVIKVRNGWDATLNGSLLLIRNDVAYTKVVNFAVQQWAGRANLVQRFKISSTFGAEVTAIYNSRRLSAANEIQKHTSQVDIALQKTFGEHAVVRLAFNDIYKGTRSRSVQDMDQFYIRSYGYYETRQVRLNFTWKLIDKNSKAPRTRSSALEAENGRVR